MNSNITINSSKFMFNNATSDVASVILNKGGVILLNRNSIINITYSNFTYNTAKFGGGVISSISVLSARKSTIRSSNFSSNIAHQYGGVIHTHDGSSFDILYSIFKNNHAFHYGGVFDSFNLSYVKVNQSWFSNNSAGYGGGVLAAKVMSSFHLVNSTFHNSSAGTIGGVIWIKNSSNLSLYKCNFFQNMADYGGAVASDRKDIITVVNSTFHSNMGKINGGIFYVNTNCKILINSSYFFNNTANNDGIIKVSDNSTLLANGCSFSGNKAGHSGGVAYAYGNSSITVNSCNFTDNKAADSGGALYGRRNSNVTIMKSLIINCTAQRFGGSISVEDGSSATLEFSNLTSSSAVDGGAVIAYQSKVNITNCTFNKNLASNAGGAICAIKACIITVQSTRFIFNSGAYGGAFFAFQKSHLLFENCEFLNNTAEFESIIQIRQQSTLFIIKCTFKNNVAENGAVMYLQTSNATIKESFYDRNQAKRKGGVIYCTNSSTVRIRFNTFCSNMAKGDGGAIALLGGSVADIESSTFIANRACSNGGTIFAQVSFVHIYNCTFNISTAISGGVVKAYAVKSLKILWSNFTSSRANKSGGVLHLMEHSNATISHSNFNENMARLYGGAISASTMSTVVINNCIFNDNNAERGGALAAQTSFISFQGGDKNEDETQVYANKASYGSGIYLKQSNLHFRMKIIFSHNQASLLGGGIHAVNSSIFIKSEVYFEHNLANMSGGGISLANSTLYDRTNYTTAITFTANHAARYGGALYVDDEAQSVCFTDSYSIPTKCFFQPTANHLKIYLSENHANFNGSDLYGGLLDRCTFDSVISTKNGPNGTAYFREMSNITSNTISSQPVRLCLCNDNKADCNEQIHSKHYLHVRQRDPLQISVVALDQVGNYVPAVVHSTLKDISLPYSQTLRKIGSNCTAMEYQSFMNFDEDYELTLYAEDPCTHNGKPISKLNIIVNVTSCLCAPGFVPADKRRECICICNKQDKILSEYIKMCNSSTESMIREGTFWITYLHHDDDNNNSSSFFVFPYCPMDYCQPPSKPVSIKFNHPNGTDAQCANNRAGILCGSCQVNYSLSLGTSKCIKCPSSWYGQFVGILITTFFTGIALVFLLLWLNLTVAIGTLNSIIFYANIIDMNKTIYFSKTYTYIKAFVSWLSLDLGFDACGFEGMDTYTKTWLQLVFPVYIISLVIIITCISSFSLKLSSILGKKCPVETLATLILLSYTKLLQAIIATFSLAIFKYPNGTKTYQWLPDATVSYGKGKHIVLICVATFILMFGLFYTLLIFFWQWLLHCPNLKLLKWMKNLKFHTFIATYHAPHVAKHRYWTGLLLLVRTFVYLISTFTVSVDPHITLLSTIIIISCLQMYKTAFLVRIYRNRLLSTMESFVFFNIAMFTIITWYTFDDQCSTSKELLQTVASYLSVGTVALTCFLVICFHVYRYGNKRIYLLGQNTRLCKKLKEQVCRNSIQNPRTPMDRESDIYQLFDMDFGYQDSDNSYSPPPVHLRNEPTSSSISLADCEEL